MILELFDTLKVNDQTVVQKEYDKLKRKLSKKYADDELGYKIKEKLYQKGFSSSEIQTCFEKEGI